MPYMKQGFCMYNVYPKFLCTFSFQVLLHLWVMVVLLTYQPEMHGADFKQPQEPPGIPH